MKSSPRLTKLRDSGFTLIELLAVIIILGILSAIVVYGVSAARDTAQAGACTANVRMLQDAENAYYLKNNKYAYTMQALYDGGFLQAVVYTDENGAETQGTLADDPIVDYQIVDASVGTVPGYEINVSLKSDGSAIPNCDTATVLNPTPTPTA